MGDTDGKKNAEPSQNGTADDISDLRRMMQGFGDNFIKLNDDLKQLQQKVDTGFQQQQQKMDTGFQQLSDKISAVELSTKKIVTLLPYIPRNYQNILKGLMLLMQNLFLWKIKLTRK